MTLLLVGGPTHSPILRNMVAEQLRPPNASVDPMTAVALGRGALRLQLSPSTAASWRARWNRRGPTCWRSSSTTRPPRSTKKSS